MLSHCWQANCKPRLDNLSLVAQMVKNLPAIQEAQVQSLGWEDPLENGMAIHFSILVWRIPCTEEPGKLQSVAKSQTRQQITLYRFLSCLLLYLCIKVGITGSIQKTLVEYKHLDLELPLTKANPVTWNTESAIVIKEDDKRLEAIVLQKLFLESVINS